MKKISLTLILAFICFLSTFSQSIEPTSFLFDYTVNDTTYTQQILNPNLFRQNSVQLGLQWGQSYQMTRSLYLNAITGGCVSPDTNYYNTKPLNLVIQPGADPLSASNRPAIFSAALMDYRPYLQITDISKLNTKLDDSDNPIFGFKYINTNTITIKNSDNHYRLYIV
jgi:hypothetical protein